MKLPNKFGTVYKMSGKRRKPWIAIITLGYDDNGKQIRKTIGTAETSPKALALLQQYHDDPLAFDNKELLFKEVYNKWYNWKFSNNIELSDKSKNRYTNAYKYYSDIYKKKFNEIDLLTIQQIIDNCKYGYATKSDIKSLFCQLYDYSKAVGIPTKNIATKYLNIGKKVKSTLHKDFSNEEIENLWNNINKIEDIDLILIAIYTGQRPSELIDPTETHLEEKYIISGIKTEAGIDRIIPIHDKILPLLENRINNNSLKMSYRKYNYRFSKVMTLLNMNHIPHDTRHTFATLADDCGMNKLCIKLIMGHEVNDITDGVYTHKNLEKLLKEVNLLK